MKKQWQYDQINHELNPMNTAVILGRYSYNPHLQNPFLGCFDCRLEVVKKNPSKMLL
jgi:hypothetical protein